MAVVSEKIRAMGEEVARELGYELVQVQMLTEHGQRLLRFTLDKPGGISINDCERFSRKIEPLLDAEDPIPYRYILDVSSAGLDRPLLKEQDYRRFVGRRIKVGFFAPIQGRRRGTAVLLGLVEDSDRLLVSLEMEDGTRLEVPMASISQARLVPDL